MSKKRKSEVNRIVEYMVTGGAWFWSGYALFALLFSVFGMDIIPAKAISYIFGLCVNFVLERFWVFSGRSDRKELDKVSLRYVVLSALNLVIDVAIIYVLNQNGISPYIGQFVASGFFTIWNYFWYKLWVFARQEPPRRRNAAPVLHRPKKLRRTRKVVKK